MTQTLAPPTMPPLTRGPDGQAIVRGLKIFKVGKFKDSGGKAHDITPEHLSEFAANFQTLRASNVLPNVPMRIDHSSSQRSVVGYFENVYTDGTFLYGDINITNVDAQRDYSAGTLRNRSLEFGSYEKNDGEVIKNVIWGCAFVDLPAVEGLFSHPSGPSSIVTFEEIPVPDQLHTFTIKGVGTTDYASVERHIAELERAVAAGPTLHKFRVNGTEASDPAIVQQHIATLETFRTEAFKAGRSAFVKQLVTDKKLAPAQEEATVAFALELPDASYEAWKKVQEAAPVISAFTQHTGDGNGNHDGRDGGVPAVLNELDTAVEVFAMQKAAGVLTVDELKGLASYRKLVLAGRTPAL